MDCKHISFSGHAVQRMFQRGLSKDDVLTVIHNGEENKMKCVLCKQGETRTGTATVTLERGTTTVIIKNVPAEVCENCSEYYLSEEITSRVLALAEDAVRHGAEIQVLRFAA